MAEQYVRKQWINGEVITATALNNMENGIENLMGTTAGINSTIKSQELQIGDTPNSISALGGNLRVDNKTTTGELAAGNAAFSGAVKVEGSGASLTVPPPALDTHAATKKYVDDKETSIKSYVDGKETNIKAIQLTANDGLSFTGSLGSSPTLSLNAATANTLGGVKIPTNGLLSISQDGILTTSFSTATTTADGLMSMADKKKLDDDVVTGIKINGDTKTPSSGVVNIGDNIITSITMNDNTLTVANGVVNLGTVITAHQSLDAKANTASPNFTGTATFEKIKIGNYELTAEKLSQLLALLENNGGE